MIGAIDVQLAALAETKGTRSAYEKAKQARLGALRKKLKAVQEQHGTQSLESELVMIGRDLNVKGMQSLQELGVTGHKHDAFLYSVMSELAAAQVRPVGTRTDAGMLSQALEPLRSGYDLAFRGAVEPFVAGHQQFGPYQVGDRQFGVDRSDGYIYPRSRLTKGAKIEDLNNKFGYDAWKKLKPSDMRAIAADLAHGGKAAAFPEENVAMFLAGMVAEPHRNQVAELTNRLVLSDHTLGDTPVFEQMPMTTGNASSGPRDRTLDASRRGSALASGEATDREIQIARDAFEKAAGQKLDDFIDRRLAEGDSLLEIGLEVKRALEAAIAGDLR
jgi:hypothetical protein